MKTSIKSNALFAILLVASLTTAAAQGTAFTYQGRMDSGGNAANGIYDLRFTIYDAAEGGGLVAGPLPPSPAPVSNGLFTVTLDFGAGVFTGVDRWLEIDVRTNGGGAFTTLVPRQKLTATPYAITAGTVTGVVPAVQLSGTIPDGLLSPSVSLLGPTIEAGEVDAPSFNTTFWRTAGNAGTAPGTHFVGTSDNQPLDLRVDNRRALRLEPAASGTINVIGGWAGNHLAPGVIGATIGGGGAGNWFGLTLTNRVTGDFGTVGGGQQNSASGFAATVGGGQQNAATNSWATVSGGIGNVASQRYATIAGGIANQAHAESVAVGGGAENQASADYATVGGGAGNIASGYQATVSGGWANIASEQSTTVGGGIRNWVAAWYATVGGGWTNLASGQAATVGGGQWNTASEFAATVAGGDNNMAGSFRTSVGGGGDNRASGDSATVAGGRGNLADNNLAAIGGGGSNQVSGLVGTVSGGMMNRAVGSYSTVGGGTNNFAGSGAATVGGGAGNNISSSFASGSTIAGGTENRIFGNALSSTIGGGTGNNIEGASQWSVIAGGAGNTNAPGTTRAVISGGQNNRVTGNYGVVPGGYRNEAATTAFAAGSAAQAAHRGAWVWADSDVGDFNPPSFASTGTNQFLIRASGGVGINTNNPQATLHVNGNIAANALRAPGAGINTGTYAFIHRAVSTNTSGNVTTIYNPLTDGDPGAIVVITHNWTADTTPAKYNTTPVGVYYAGSRWAIFNEDLSSMGLGRAFNVLVIKP